LPGTGGIQRVRKAGGSVAVGQGLRGESKESVRVGLALAIYYGKRWGVVVNSGRHRKEMEKQRTDNSHGGQRRGTVE